jgi:hypothetical protein
MTKIDCLVCHDTTGTYKKTPTAAGMPDPEGGSGGNVAKNVGPPPARPAGTVTSTAAVAKPSSTRISPGSCSIRSAAATSTWAGTIFSAPTATAPATTKSPGAARRCRWWKAGCPAEGCHTDKPHYGDLLDHHLNKHSDTIACTTCHAPVYAKCKPTKTFWDWSKAGDKNRKAEKRQIRHGGLPLEKRRVHLEGVAKPVYRWYGGFMERVLLGDKIGHGRRVRSDLTKPVGSINDPGPRYRPSRSWAAFRPVDQENHYLLVPHLFPKGKDDKTAYWKHRDWQKAFTPA